MLDEWLQKLDFCCITINDCTEIQKWFLVNKKYYLMDEDEKSEKVLDGYEKYRDEEH
uniref:Phage protein n=1 Tax=Meloidogyne hapla TaxID=6305 RepID=A0A1I8B856_MELHA